jgi:hypothetical protein
MCTGLEIAALGAMVGGTAASAKGAASQRKAGANAQNSNTRLSRREFDSRDATAREVFAENFGIDKNAYAAIAGLDDAEFAARTGLQKSQFQALNDIDKAQVIRDASLANANTAEVGASRVERTGTEDAARAQYEADLAAANTRQAGFRGQADASAGETLSFFSPAARAANYGSAVGARDALVNRAVTPGASSVPLSGSADGDLRAAFAAESAKGRGKALASAGAASRLAGYGDALSEGDRRIAQGDERVAFISDAAQRAMAPLGATLDASSLKYNNAGQRYAQRTGVADEDLRAGLGLSEMRAAGERRPVNDYTSAMDGAYAAYFGGNKDTLGTQAGAKIGANNSRLQGTNSASQNLEGQVGAINNFRAGNATGGFAAGFGQFANALAPTLMGIGQRSAANAFAKTTPTTSAFTYGRIPGIK